MQLGFVSAILPDLTFEQVLRTAAETGFDCVEVCCWPVGKAERRYAGVTHIDAGDLSDELVTSIQSQLDRHGIRISALGYYPNPLSPGAEEAASAVAHIRAVIAAAEAKGLSGVEGLF